MTAAVRLSGGLLIVLSMLTGCGSQPKDSRAAESRGAGQQTSPKPSGLAPSKIASSEPSGPATSGPSLYRGDLVVISEYDKPGKAFDQPSPGISVTVMCDDNRCVIIDLGTAVVTIMGVNDVDKGIPLLQDGPGRYRIDVSEIPGNFCAQDTPARKPTTGTVAFIDRLMTLEATQPGASCGLFSSKYSFKGELVKGEPVT